MKNDLALMDVQRVIIHEVPRHSRTDDGEGPILSEVESPLDTDLKSYLKERVIGSLTSSQAFDIAIDPMSNSPVPQLIIDYTSQTGSRDFVAVSRRMAEHLYDIQTGSNPAGLLAVIDCSIDSFRGLGILKLEREKGARIAQQDVGGKKTYNIQILRDLILTEKTKVFKVGLFVRSGVAIESVDAAASDHQRGRFHRMEVADFFLKRFLGCKLTEEPEVSTKRFFDVAEDFINQYVDDPVRRARYHNHLVSVLTSETLSVSPRKFAEDYLKTSDRQKFLGYLASRHAPTAQFMLETSLVRARLEKVEYRFRDGVSIVTPAESEGDKVKLTRLAVMLRRALEAVCDDRKVPSGTLQQRLAVLVERRELPATLAEMTNILRTLGNAGAHHRNAKITVPMTWAMADFFHAVVEYVYIAPSKIQDFKKRMATFSRSTDSKDIRR